MNKNIQMGENTFVLPIDMDNRSLEDIAKEAALRIIEVCNQVAEERGFYTKKDGEKPGGQGEYRNEKDGKYTENMENRAD